MLLTASKCWRKLNCPQPGKITDWSRAFLVYQLTIVWRDAKFFMHCCLFDVSTQMHFIIDKCDQEINNSDLCVLLSNWSHCYLMQNLTSQNCFRIHRQKSGGGLDPHENNIQHHYHFNICFQVKLGWLVRPSWFQKERTYGHNYHRFFMDQMTFL